MFNRYGFLIRSEKSENQNTIKDPELGNILNDLYITDNKEFWGDLNGWCTTSSYNRCCFYMSMNYENKTYTQKNRKIPYVLPTYGVKGTDAISRDMKYVNQYLQKFEEMCGSRFIDYAFGTDYIRHEEPQQIVSNASVIERLQHRIKTVSHEVEDTELVCRVLDRIWAAREQDSKTRIIIVLEKEDIEKKSMDILRQLYLLMPQRLRIQTGFATNVNVGDLDMISKNALPMYILTTDEETVNNLSSEYLRGLKFPVEFIELKAIDLYPCDEKRLKLLKSHSENYSEITEYCMAYAERKAMERNKQDYSSFRIYEEILRLTYTAELYWWNDKSLTTIQEICEKHMDQLDIMEIPQIKNEAMRRFYTEYIPEGDYAAQILEAVCDLNYPKREMILNCLREQLFYGKEIDAIAAYAQKRDQERADLIEANSRAEQEKLDAQEKQLLSEKEQEIQILNQDHDAVIDGKEQEIQHLKEEQERQQQENAKKVAEDSEKIKRLTEEKAELHLIRMDLKEQLKKQQKTLSKYSSQEDIDKLENANSELKAAKKKIVRTKNIFLTLSIVLLLAGGGITGFGAYKMQKVNNSNMDLEAKLDEVTKSLNEKGALESEKVVLESEMAELEKKITILESEKAVLESEKAAVESEKESELQQQDQYVPMGILY